MFSRKILLTTEKFMQNSSESSFVPLEDLLERNCLLVCIEA